MEKVTEKVLNEIQTKHIVPIARWHFLARNAAFWSFAIVTVFVGGLAISTTIFLVSQYDEDALVYFDMGRAEYALQMLPIFWIALLCLLTAFSSYMVRHTKRGYRYPLLVILGGTVLSSGILGYAAYAFGVGSAVDDLLIRHAPQYTVIVRHKVDMWVRPSEGFLAGTVLERGGDSLLIEDLKNKTVWKVYQVEGFVADTCAALEEGSLVKFIGEMKEDDAFYAHEARSWERCNAVARPEQR